MSCFWKFSSFWKFSNRTTPVLAPDKQALENLLYLLFYTGDSQVRFFGLAGTVSATRRYGGTTSRYGFSDSQVRFGRSRIHDGLELANYPRMRTLSRYTTRRYGYGLSQPCEAGDETSKSNFCVVIAANATRRYGFHSRY